MRTMYTLLFFTFCTLLSPPLCAGDSTFIDDASEISDKYAPYLITIAKASLRANPTDTHLNELFETAEESLATWKKMKAEAKYRAVAKQTETFFRKVCAFLSKGVSSKELSADQKTEILEAWFASIPPEHIEAYGVDNSLNISSRPYFASILRNLSEIQDTLPDEKATCWDLGAASGNFGKLVSMVGYNVTSVDFDDTLYQMHKEEHARHISGAGTHNFIKQDVFAFLKESVRRGHKTHMITATHLLKFFNIDQQKEFIVLSRMCLHPGGILVVAGDSIYHPFHTQRTQTNPAHYQDKISVGQEVEMYSFCFEQSKMIRLINPNIRNCPSCKKQYLVNMDQLISPWIPQNINSIAGSSFSQNAIKCHLVGASTAMLYHHRYYKTPERFSLRTMDDYLFFATLTKEKKEEGTVEAATKQCLIQQALPPSPKGLEVATARLEAPKPLYPLSDDSESDEDNPMPRSAPLEQPRSLVPEGWLSTDSESEEED